MRDLKSLTEEDAVVIVDYVKDTVRRLEVKSVSVAVVDVRGNVLSAIRMDGALPHTFDVAICKGKTAALYERDTVLFSHVEKGGEWVRGEARDHRADDNRRLVSPFFCSWAGGVAVFSDGHGVVGGIGISGLHELDDHELGEKAVDHWELTQ